MTGRPSIIDTKMHGFEGVTAAFLLEGERTALVETGPKSRVDNVFAGLADHGIGDLDWIIVTHIHLDHAGAAGTLSARFPNARVAVHEVGAPHLVDPTKLWSSASRIYGDRMEEMWGGIDPIPEERIEVIRDGDTIDLGGYVLRAIETPGHAYHHHAYLDESSGIMFTGDALGVRLSDVGVVRPATPPPEFHLEKAIASIELIAERAPEDLWLTHFGPASEGADPRSVEELCHDAIESLRTWAEWVQNAREETTDLDEVTTRVRQSARAKLEGSFNEGDIERMEQTTSYWMNTWGYLRYFDKREQAKEAT